MKLETTLTGQTLQNRVREIGTNPDYWYPVLWASELKPGQVMAVAVWQQAIALYRDTNGHLHALENACPHKGVELHQGEVKGDRLVCPYHGWEFGSDGQCLHIPYFAAGQKLPCATARAYPVQERYGLIWVFPGDPQLAAARSLPPIPEFSDPNCLMVPVRVNFKVHFSLCNENGMDVFHGFLHQKLQAWFDPILVNLQETDASVKAEYQVSYRGWLTKILGLSAETNPAKTDRAENNGVEKKGVTTRIATIHYQYPHYCNTMEGISSLYLLRLPIGLNQTSSFALIFLNQVRLPKWLLKAIQPLLVPLIRRFLFMPLAIQDIQMMESERRTYEANPNRRYVEVNPAVIALQRVMIRQYDRALASSNESPNGHSAKSVEPSEGDYQESITH